MDGSNYPNINAFYTKTGSSILLLVFCLCKYNNRVTWFLNRAYRYHVLNKLLILVLYRYEIGILFSLVMFTMAYYFFMHLICLCALANRFYYDIVQYCTVSKYKLSTFRVNKSGDCEKLISLIKTIIEKKDRHVYKYVGAIVIHYWLKKKSRTIRNKLLLMSQLVL